MADASSWSADHFRALYARDPDPWKFATSDYERDKYAATLALLGERRFRACFEVGCSIGVLTRQLAARCDTLLGVDVADAALDSARAGCAGLEGVRFANMSVPGQWPEGRFDLILFSEVLYYLGLDGIQRAAKQAMACLEPGGLVLLCNWSGPTDGACPGSEAAERFIRASAPPLVHVERRDAEKYRMDLLASA